MNAEETKSLIPYAEAAEKKWFLNHKPARPVKEVNVRFTNGKSYRYLSRTECTPNDVFTIDYGGATSCCMGQVEEVGRIEHLKPFSAMNPLFVFSTDPGKREIKRNVSADKTIDPEIIIADHNYWGCCMVDRYIANILDSITVLAFSKFVDDEAIAEAEKYLKTKCFVPAELFSKNIQSMLDYSIAYGTGNIVFSGYYPGWLEDFKSLGFWNKDCIKKTIDRTHEKYNCYIIEYHVKDEVTGDLFEKDPEFLEAFNELVYRSALSILIRGGFVNLLEAALTAEMPIDAYYDKLIDYANEIGSTYCCKVLKEARK